MKSLTPEQAEALLDQIQKIIGPACGGNEEPHTPYFLSFVALDEEGCEVDITGSNLVVGDTPAYLHELADSIEAMPEVEPAAYTVRKN